MPDIITLDVFDNDVNDIDHIYQLNMSSISLYKYNELNKEWIEYLHGCSCIRTRTIQQWT